MEEELAREAVNSMFFAPPLVKLADLVERKMTEGGKRAHNALHLRIEGDAIAHGMVEGMGGLTVRRWRADF